MASVGKNFFSTEEEELRWGVRLSEAVKTAKVKLEDLASYLGVDEETVKSLVEEKSTATLQQQQLIAACLRRSVRELFTDVPPAHRTVVVPNLIGEERGALKQKLAEVGLRLGDAHEAPSDEVPAGKVVDQAPAADEKVTRDTTVNVTVSVGPTE
jgi:predicted transcriptional regulator